MNPQVLAYLPLMTPIATLIVVVVGVFFSNHHLDVRISDLRGSISDLRAHLDARFVAMDQLFQERLRRVEEVMDARLSRIEQEIHLK